MVGRHLILDQYLTQLKVQSSRFPETGKFSVLQAKISKTIDRNEMKNSPVRSPFISEQEDVLFRHLHRKIVVYSVPEQNVYLTGKKSSDGKLYQWPLIDSRRSIDPINR